MKKLLILIVLPLVLAGCGVKKEMVNKDKTYNSESQLEVISNLELFNKIRGVEKEIYARDEFRPNGCVTFPDYGDCWSERMAMNLDDMRERILLLEDYLNIKYQPATEIKKEAGYIKK